MSVHQLRSLTCNIVSETCHLEETEVVAEVEVEEWDSMKSCVDCVQQVSTIKVGAEGF